MDKNIKCRMNIETFREDVRTYIAESGLNAYRLSRQARVETSSLYNFLNGKASLSGDSVMKLWPFIYENPRRKPPTATPTTPPEPERGEGGEDAV